MKILLVTILLLSNLLAYKKGDEINLDTATHLGLEDGKIYVIDFFVSWADSSAKKIPLISKANLKIDKNSVEIIGVNVDKDMYKGVNFQNRLQKEGKLNFRVVNDPQNSVIAEFNPLGMPTLYYVKNRKILNILEGKVENIDRQILENLKGIE